MKKRWCTNGVSNKVSIKREPVIWRRLRIPGNITFQQLHQIIQAAFGWSAFCLKQWITNKLICSQGFVSVMDRMPPIPLLFSIFKTISYISMTVSGKKRK
ncbi:MAG: IS1096 element passenger TnpR family protein [Tepidanaerobacteraceae bacterium]